MTEKMKTLIAFRSKMGKSAESAKIIASILREKFNLQVEVVDLKEEKKKKSSWRSIKRSLLAQVLEWENDTEEHGNFCTKMILVGKKSSSLSVRCGL